jgi:TP901 family phage tail tape measure protein
MASVTATINVQINAANAAAQLTALQGKVAAMNKGMLAATAGGVMAQEKAIRRMGNVLTGSGSFTTGIRNVHTELGRLHSEFDRGTTSLQNYRRNSQMFSKDHSQINRMAADRVRMMQSQYVALGKEMNGVQKAMQIKPTGMMREFGAETMYANQRATLFRRNLQMGSTALVNWGKNTQWAGRQMMVGMGIPIAIAAAGAVKAYNDIEQASISFKRVYGDTTTDAAEKTRMLGQVHDTVGKEMMKYGVAMSDTLDVSAKAAATGAQGADLIAATRETMRLATLGNMDYSKALEATIAMQTAFNINSKDMAQTTDFLNAVENQTILTMEDMALAVPRVAPVIKGLGGNVEDLAIMMTALRQGGVSAEQGANALKSGLGSLLNPTGTAIDQFDQMGINLKKIVDTNKGDLIGTLQGLGKALGGLTKYDRQRALESLFGKYQYARMGALLKNINSKAVKETMKMAKAGAGELAKMSAQELSQISDSPMIKLRASIEELKAAAAPLGALFSDIGAKIISGITPVVDFFANNDAAKWGLVAAAGFAAIAGTVTMVVGVFSNFAGSMVKAGMALKSFFRFATGQRSLSYVATDELNASAAANSLATASERAATGLYAQANAAKLLTSQLEALIAAQTGAAGTATATGRGGGVVPRTNAPVPAAPRVTEAQMISMLKTSGNTVRAHVGQPMILSKAAEDALRATYLDANGNPLASKKQRGIDVQAGLKNGTIRGYSAMTLGWGSKTNAALSLGNKAGVPTQHLLDQLRLRPEEVMAPLLDDLARNSNMTTAQLIADPDVQKWAKDTTQKMSSGIATAGINAWHDPDVAKVVDPILQSMGKDLPKYRLAIERMLLPEQILTHPGAKRFEVSKEVASKAPEEFAAPRPKEASTAKALEAVAPLAGKLGSLPQVQVDSNGKSVAVVHPKGSATPQTVEALKPKTIKPAMPMKIAYSEQASRAIADKGPKVPAGRQFSGMGLMGAGMLASTAFMGLEMAGKQVPAAAEFAANGLMGIGMTVIESAQMFPGSNGQVVRWAWSGNSGTWTHGALLSEQLRR